MLASVFIIVDLSTLSFSSVVRAATVFNNPLRGHMKRTLKDCTKKAPIARLTPKGLLTTERAGTLEGLVHLEGSYTERARTPRGLVHREGLTPRGLDTERAYTEGAPTLRGLVH